MIDSSLFKRNPNRNMENPVSFGFEPHQVFLSEDISIGAFTFASRFIFDFMSKDLAPVPHLESNRDTEIKLMALRDNRGTWRVAPGGNYIHRLNNPEEDSVGDVRVKFYTNKLALYNDRVPVSILGLQRGGSIEFQNPESLFLIKIGTKANGNLATASDLMEPIRVE